MLLQGGHSSAVQLFRLGVICGYPLDLSISKTGQGFIEVRDDVGGMLKADA